MNKVAQSLTKLFDKHRIVFWYDNNHELRQEFDALALEEVEKIELTNNEFGVKHRILRKEPKAKFLLYRDGPQPSDLENWLLDTQLAHGEFRTDLAATWLAELELGLEFSDLAQEHAVFFQSEERKSALKRLLKSDDSASAIRLKMLSVCTGGAGGLDMIVEALLGELSSLSNPSSKEFEGAKYKLLKRCELAQFLWEQVGRYYNYHASQLSIKDFALRLFQDCYYQNFSGSVVDAKPLFADAHVFLKRWKDSITWKQSFETLSAQCASDLGIEQDLAKRDIPDLVELDHFRLIDQKIVSDLVRYVAKRTVSAGEVALWVRQRRQSHWYVEFEHLYEAIDSGAQFMQALDEADFTMESLTSGVQKYSRSWFRLDRLYRKFVYHVRLSGEATLMETLSELVENLYVNNYLLKVNDCWQKFVDGTPFWSVDHPVQLQRSFFNLYVKPILDKDKKIFVIISDALRYEIGDELVGVIRKEDRYEASIEPLMAMLPSYTQLGMAALLPHTTLALAEIDSGGVEVDGRSSRGFENRKKQLEKSCIKRATALKAAILMDMNGDDRRVLVRDHDAIYVYHNCIDATGHKRESEERVFEAAETTIEEIVKLIKKLTGANANNILVTADHGFIYQNHPIAESDFVSAEAKGDQILFRDRRFNIGKGLKENPSLAKFSSAQLGLTGELEVQIPKSINRQRLKGSGSRYVHGGASLQEVVIPVIKINKKRTSDTTAVEVDILRGASSIITSGQIAVMFYQLEAVTDKVQPRALRAGIFSQSGELLSDSHELNFCIQSQNPREREFKVAFVLSRKADEVNGQEVSLRLEEKIPGTERYKVYRAVQYTMRRSFTSDFDF
jgi:uncharacterized protein (TIGR02687 family)